MSLASSVDLREFRNGAGGRQHTNDYAYADPMEEMGRGPRQGGRSHRLHKDHIIPSRGSHQPLLLPPQSRHYPQGPIITTPSMEMSLSRHPVRHQPWPSPYPPEPYPQFHHHTNNVAYPAQPLGGGQSSDMLVMFAAVLMFFCCPLSVICTAPACFCLLQGQQLDSQGRPAEAAMRRNYSLGLICLGGVIALLLELGIAAAVIIIYYAN